VADDCDWLKQQNVSRPQHFVLAKTKQFQTVLCFGFILVLFQSCGQFSTNIGTDPITVDHAVHVSGAESSTANIDAFPTKFLPPQKSASVTVIYPGDFRDVSSLVAALETNRIQFRLVQLTLCPSVSTKYHRKKSLVMTCGNPSPYRSSNRQ